MPACCGSSMNTGLIGSTSGGNVGFSAHVGACSGTRGRWFKSTRLYHPQSRIAENKKRRRICRRRFRCCSRLAPAVAAVPIARRRNVTRRIGVGPALRSAEYPIEKVVAAAIAVTAAAAIHAELACAPAWTRCSAPARLQYRRPYARCSSGSRTSWRRGRKHPRATAACRLRPQRLSDRSDKRDECREVDVDLRCPPNINSRRASV